MIWIAGREGIFLEKQAAFYLAEIILALEFLHNLGKLSCLLAFQCRRTVKQSTLTPTNVKILTPCRDQASSTEISSRRILYVHGANYVAWAIRGMNFDIIVSAC